MPSHGKPTPSHPSRPLSRSPAAPHRRATPRIHHAAGLCRGPPRPCPRTALPALSPPLLSHDTPPRYAPRPLRRGPEPLHRKPWPPLPRSARHPYFPLPSHAVAMHFRPYNVHSPCVGVPAPAHPDRSPGPGTLSTPSPPPGPIPPRGTRPSPHCATGGAPALGPGPTIPAGAPTSLRPWRPGRGP